MESDWVEVEEVFRTCDECYDREKEENGEYIEDP